MKPKSINLLPNQLSENTRLRFTEIEMSKGLHILSKITETEEEATHILARKLTAFNPELTDELQQAFIHYPFKAKHNEVIQYLRYRNLGIQKIRKYVQETSKSLQIGGKHDIIPSFDPIFPHWHKIPYAIATWNEYIKPTLNLFKEDLIHTTEPKEKEIQQQPIKQPKAEEEEPIKTIEELLEEDEDNPYVQANKFLNNWGK